MNMLYILAIPVVLIIAFIIDRRSQASHDEDMANTFASIMDKVDKQ